MSAYTSEQLTNLKAAVAQGVLKVRDGDTWVEYQSLREMRELVAEMEYEIGNKTRPRGTRLLRYRGGR